MLKKEFYQPEGFIIEQVQKFDHLQKEIIQTVREYSPKPTEPPGFSRNIEGGFFDRHFTTVQRWTSLDRVISFCEIDKLPRNFLGTGFVEVCCENKIKLANKNSKRKSLRTYNAINEEYSVSINAHLDNPTDAYVRGLVENIRINDFYLQTTYFFMPDGSYKKTLWYPSIPLETNRLSWTCRQSTLELPEAKMIENILGSLLLKVQNSKNQPDTYSMWNSLLNK